MKNGHRMHKIAGLTEKDLPVTAARSDGENLPVAPEESSPGPARVERIETARSIAAAVAAEIETTRETSQTTQLPTGFDTRLRALERTHDILALHATRLRDSSSDRLQIVIKPGAGVQIALDIRRGEGGIEVQATLQRGDFEHLNRHWTELQERLETRGVRVSSLTCYSHFNHAGGGAFHQRHRPQADADTLAAGAFAEFAFAGSMTESVTQRGIRSRTHRGWETWA